jgi:hypothetical protein
MTYTEAVAHNAQFKLPAGYKDIKEVADGISLRWVIDPAGRIGYIKKSRPDAILVYYPIKVFKVSVRIGIWSWSINEWNKFKLL